MVRSGLVVVVLAVAAMAGCSSSDRVEGCTPPPNETALLDEYVKEPVLAVQPGEPSRRREEPKRSTACRKVGKSVSTTSIGVQWDVGQNFTLETVENLYRPATTGAGWTVVPNRSGVRYVQFCKNILGQRSILDVSWSDITVLAGGKAVPGEVSVGVRIAGEAEPTCP